MSKSHTALVYHLLAWNNSDASVYVIARGNIVNYIHTTHHTNIHSHNFTRFRQPGKSVQNITQSTLSACTHTIHTRRKSRFVAPAQIFTLMTAITVHMQVCKFAHLHMYICIYQQHAIVNTFAYTNSLSPSIFLCSFTHTHAHTRAHSNTHQRPNIPSDSAPHTQRLYALTEKAMYISAHQKKQYLCAYPP